ncbi:uncharacterized protein KIAA1958-like [Oculina patagonica]
MKIFNEWLATRSEFTVPILQMEKPVLSKCLKKFYLCIRKKDGSFFKIYSLKAIRAAIDRFLKSAPNNKPWSIISDPQFKQANDALDAFAKSVRREGKVGGVVHKSAITREQIEVLFERQQLGPANTTCPAQLLRTSWFYVTLYFGKRGRENQRQMTKRMLVLRTTPGGQRFYELQKAVPGAVFATKNHQGGLNDEEDESDGKMFEVPGSPRCPVKTVENYISHLNPEMEFLFQRPRALTGKFNPEADSVWYCNSPLGVSYLSSMMRTMSTNANIIPPLTNHCVRATSVTILSEANVETRHIKSVTGHKSDTSIESYSNKPSFQQKEKMSAILSSFVGGENISRSDEQVSLAQKTSVDISQTAQSCGVLPRPPLENLSLSVNVQQPATTLPSQAFFQASAPNFQFQGCSVTIVNNNYFGSPQ